MIVKTIRDVKKLAGKRVLLRTDCNVPYSKGRVKDDYKLQSQLPTIRYLLNHKCRVIIITHFGRPQGKNVKKYSLKPIATHLSKLLKKRIVFVNDIAADNFCCNFLGNMFVLPMCINRILFLCKFSVSLSIFWVRR